MEGMILSFHFDATACALSEQTLSPHFHRNETLLLLLDDWRSKVGCVECAMPCPVLSHLSNGPGGRSHLLNDTERMKKTMAIPLTI